MSIIIIHELGHSICALYFKRNIDKISLYPFGGNISYTDLINRSIKEDIYILLSGPILQIIYYFILYVLYECQFIHINTFNMITNYHYAILLFNLLPIFPLDGSKIINLSLNKILPFKLSHKISLYISYVGLFFLLYMTRYINFNTNFYLLLVLLLTKIIEEGKNHESIFNKFLLERYLYDFHFSKLKIIKGKLLDKMMHSKNHLFKMDEKLKTEKEVLKTRYQKDKPNLH